jgi:hypothetical protein
MRIIPICFFLYFLSNLSAQIVPIIEENSNLGILDSLYISDIENRPGKAKVLHAEPLYIDLIRDLGARKGEKEWNVAFGLQDNQRYDEYEALVEYEWAPVDRLGLEVELPFSFYYPTAENSTAPSSKLNSLKMAAQYSFYVSDKHNLSMALGYIHEFEMTSFNEYRSQSVFKGNVFNPFFIGAKRLNNNFHTLIYTGPAISKHFGQDGLEFNWQVNSNIHYMITGTRNFIGVELNKEFYKDDFDMVIRPQMRLGINDRLMIGIVTGIPVKRENQRFSSFLRIIYEPGH